MELPLALGLGKHERVVEHLEQFDLERLALSSDAHDSPAPCERVARRRPVELHDLPEPRGDGVEVADFAWTETMPVGEAEDLEWFAAQARRTNSARTDLQTIMDYLDAEDHISYGGAA